MASTHDLGAAIPLLKGEYDAATRYEQNNIVIYNSSTYWHYSATATTGEAPTNTTYWRLVVDASIAASAAVSAAASKSDAEAWAVGQRGGVDVGSSDETYHNNAKYYAEYCAAALAAIAAEGEAF